MEYLETLISESIIINLPRNNVIFQCSCYIEVLGNKPHELVNKSLLYALTIECHIQINGTSDNPVHLSLRNMKSGLMTRLATLLTNSSCMTKAIRCHKRHPHSYTTTQ